MPSEELRIKKAAIEREQSDACIGYAEREQARDVVSTLNIEFMLRCSI